MKTLKAAIIATILSFSFAAQSSEICDLEKQYAELVMELRQGGVDISEVLDLVGRDSDFRHIVVNAYKEPAMMSESNRERVVREYALKVYLECLED